MFGRELELILEGLRYDGLWSKDGSCHAGNGRMLHSHLEEAILVLPGSVEVSL